ncbi:MAG: hypothetical protein K6E86_03090 [Bacteroidales bacterium]|nr:hypothetical protein [Bacteroidales bacterium]
MARLSSSCEQRFRQNFEKEFDWITFNKFYLSMLPLKRIAIAIDPSYITKSGKCTPVYFSTIFAVQLLFIENSKRGIFARANIPSVAPSALDTISYVLLWEAGAHAPACIPAHLRRAA